MKTKQDEEQDLFGCLINKLFELKLFHPEKKKKALWKK